MRNLTVMRILNRSKRERLAEETYTPSPQAMSLTPTGQQVSRQRHALRGVFIALFVQLQTIVLASLCVPKGIVFVREHSFGFDLQDFISAAQDWRLGLNPYGRPRLVTPPPTLLFGYLFRNVEPQSAARVFLCVNILAIFGSVWMICRYFQMERRALWLMMGITSLYYPVIFLFERGNLDGLMLLLVCAAIVAKDVRLRAALLACSIVLKVYTVLFFGSMVAAKRFRVLLLTVLAVAILLAPFYALLWPYLRTSLDRTAQFTAVENLSPAVVLGALSKRWLGKVLFIVLWAGSLLRATWRHRRLPFEEQLIVCLPWMAAFPLQVYPYTGVLLLPVLAWQLGSTRMVVSRLALGVFLAGFTLVSTQQGALNEYFLPIIHTHRFFPFLNVLGTVCVLSSLAAGPTVEVASPVHP